ncbi:galactokinase, partial [Escherichia coli]|nr:galactokinase [Escherichia coli]
YAVVQKRHDRKIRMYSKNFSEAGVIESSLEQLTYKTEDDWANYPKGVMDTFKKHGYDLPFGFDILFFGNIPNGAGLSS